VTKTKQMSEILVQIEN